MNKRILEGYARHDIVKLLPEVDCVGVELGVAGGAYSERMMASGRFKHFFGVDMYADKHDVEEYKKTLTRLDLFSSYKLLRMTFDDALSLFDDGALDFVYVDGYAGTGEEGGKTLTDWYRKVRVGGVLAGDDYHEDWPLVVAAVNHLANEAGAELLVTELTETTEQNHYPTWAIVKSVAREITPDPILLQRGRDRFRRKRRKFLVKQIRRNVASLFKAE